MTKGPNYKSYNDFRIYIKIPKNRDLINNKIIKKVFYLKIPLINYDP